MEKGKKREFNRTSNIISIILSIIFIPIILLNIVIIMKACTQPDHIPGAFGIKPVIVMSSSMSPVFENNSLAFIKEVDTESLKAGDIICYLAGSSAITHRIEQVITENGQTRYITKGDANNSADRLSVLPEQVEGIYIGNIAGLGSFITFAQSVTGIILFVFLPILLYIIFDIIIKARESRKAKYHAAMVEDELKNLHAQKDSVAV